MCFDRQVVVNAGLSVCTLLLFWHLDEVSSAQGGSDESAERGPPRQIEIRADGGYGTSRQSDIEGKGRLVPTINQDCFRNLCSLEIQLRLRGRANGSRDHVTYGTVPSNIITSSGH